MRHNGKLAVRLGTRRTSALLRCRAALLQFVAIGEAGPEGLNGQGGLGQVGPGHNISAGPAAAPAGPAITLSPCGA